MYVPRAGEEEGIATFYISCLCFLSFLSSIQCCFSEALSSC